MLSKSLQTFLKYLYYLTYMTAIDLSAYNNYNTTAACIYSPNPSLHSYYTAYLTSLPITSTS